MTDLNDFCFIGHGLKILNTEKGTMMLSFTLAVNRDHKKKDTDEWYETTSFIDLTVFGKRAQSLQKWLEKGRAVSVRAHLEQERWEKDGKSFSRLKVYADELNPFIERKVKDSSSTQIADPEVKIENDNTDEQYLDLTPSQSTQYDIF